MEIKYTRTPTVSNMIVIDRSYDGYEKRMRLENTILGLLDCTISVHGDNTEYWFDTTRKRTLKSYFMSEGIDSGDIMSILRRIKNACLNMENYLLKPDGLLIGIDTIYIEETERGILCYLAYIPGQTLDFDNGLKSIMEHLIRNVDHTHMETTKLVYKLFERVNKGEIDLDVLIDICEEESSPVELAFSEKYEQFFPEPKHESEEVVFDSSFLDDDLFEEERKPIISHLIDRIKGIRHKGTEERTKDEKYAVDFQIEDTPIESTSAPETELLSDIHNHGASLVYDGPGNHSSFFISHVPFKIGSKREISDGYIFENTISRCHAIITKEDGTYYIEDMESKNGTFVNKMLLGYSQKVNLKNGDLVSFANVEYKFFDI